MNIAELLLANGEDDTVAVLYRKTALTYRDLRDSVTRVARGLIAGGFAKGDRIAILSENSPFFVIAYLASIRAGLVAVPLPTELLEESLLQMIRDAGAKALFVSQRMETRLRWRAAGPGLALVLEKELQGFVDDSASTFPEIDPVHDLAALMFTSGSTGLPKGVMVTHRNIECNTRDIVAYMGLCRKDRVLTVLPFHYCFGASLLHTHLMAGGALVLDNEFKLYPEAALRDMREHECTGIAGVPSTFQFLLRKSRFRQMTFPALRWFQQAGGKLPNPHIAEILDAFPDVQYFLMYGQTEATARLSYLPPEFLVPKLGSIGKGLPSTRLEVLKPDGVAVVPGSCETGEIVASGDNIALGYWNDPVETSKYFRGKKLYTGDIARVDSDGFIYIVEREREMIKSGGNRVSAKEVEDVIAELPAIVEVAVVGAPHELLGEAIRAFVVPVENSTMTPHAVMAHCRGRLPHYKTPDAVIFLKQMPHTPAGKVNKQVLRAKAAQALAEHCSGSLSAEPSLL